MALGEAGDQDGVHFPTVQQELPPAAAFLGHAGVPAGRINNLRDVFDCDFAAEAELVRYLPHALAQDVPTVSNPVKFSMTPIQYGRAAPVLGEHTDEVLMHQLGYTKEMVASLRQRRTV